MLRARSSCVQFKKKIHLILHYSGNIPKSSQTVPLILGNPLNPKPYITPISPFNFGKPPFDCYKQVQPRGEGWPMLDCRLQSEPTRFFVFFNAPFTLRLQSGKVPSPRGFGFRV